MDAPRAGRRLTAMAQRSNTKRTDNLAARAGRWSAQHRKKAIFGWLAFVILAVFIGGSVGTRTLTDDEYGIGESGRADKAVSDALPRQGRRERPGPEPERGEATRARSTGSVVAVGRDQRSRAPKHVRNVQSPYAEGNEGTLSQDGKSALVTFDIPGEDSDAEDKVDAAARRGLQARQAGDRLPDRGVRRRQRGQGAEQGVRGRLPQGGGHLAADHADHPDPRFWRAAGGLRAAAARHHRGGRGDQPDRRRSARSGRWTRRSARSCC